MLITRVAISFSRSDNNLRTLAEWLFFSFSSLVFSSGDSEKNADSEPENMAESRKRITRRKIPE